MRGKGEKIFPPFFFLQSFNLPTLCFPKHICYFLSDKKCGSDDFLKKACFCEFRKNCKIRLPPEGEKMVGGKIFWGILKN